jgi:trans-L-3-hydroxyproline dehydratase
MKWKPPRDWHRITAIDVHTEGEPLRVVTTGIDPIPGKTILDKRQYARENLDGLRRTLMFEPRGHADMYGAILTEPVTEDSDMGVLFMHNEGWSTMCGHGVIALVTAVLETGMLSPRRVVKLDTPAGRVAAYPRFSKRLNQKVDRVMSVAFENVPSFVYAIDQHIEVPGVGRIRYDIAFGGAFYAFVEATEVGVELSPKDFRRMIEYGMLIKRAIMASQEIRHPFEDDLSFLYGTIFVGPAISSQAHSRNVCIFAEGEVDRSPTGTGVSARLAIEIARRRLKQGELFIVESIIGTRFTGRAIATTKFGNHEAVIPEIEGRAWITGRSEFFISPDDPLKEGFILR